MKILNLTKNSKIYTSNVFLVLGSHNAIEDTNTLVDVGRDPAVIDKINNASTGVGKKRVGQVILTHSHYDHSTLLPIIREVFNPVVYAFSPFFEGADHILKNGDHLKLGDSIFEIIYTPGHSNDSICLYSEKKGILFAGDTQLRIRTADVTYEENYIKAVSEISRRDIRSIYFGHGPDMHSNCNEMIHESLKNIRSPLEKEQKLIKSLDKLAFGEFGNPAIFAK